MKEKPAPLNFIWLFMIVAATVTAAFTGKMAALTTVSFEATKSAVTLAISLVGAMALWLGIMKVAEEAGLMNTVARAIRPLMVRLFPGVPADHPAMSAIIMNMAANMLGLGNAATPMGIRAMQELDRINPEKGRATDAMCLFLAINTSSVTILPLGVITIRAAAGAASPANIFFPTLVATVCSTAVAIAMSKVLAHTGGRREAAAGAGVAAAPASGEKPQDVAEKTQRGKPGRIGAAVMLCLLAAFVAAVVLKFARGGVPPVYSYRFLVSATNWLMPLLLCMFLLTGFFRGVKVYETVTDGAKEGFNVAIRIIPFMVAIFVAIGMFRESGAMDILAWLTRPLTGLIGMPAEALPMALLRPLSGSGAFGLMAETVNKAPDSFLAYLVSTIQGSTETTFYVLAVYFGAVGIRKTRYALPAALCADAVGILAAVLICRVTF